MYLSFIKALTLLCPCNASLPLGRGMCWKVSFVVRTKAPTFQKDHPFLVEVHIHSPEVAKGTDIEQVV